MIIETDSMFCWCKWTTEKQQQKKKTRYVLSASKWMLFAPDIFVRLIATLHCTFVIFHLYLQLNSALSYKRLLLPTEPIKKMKFDFFADKKKQKQEKKKEYLNRSTNQSLFSFI